MYDVHSGGGDDHGLVQLRAPGPGLGHTDCQRDGPRPTDSLLLLLLQFYHGKDSDGEENVSDILTAGPGPDLHRQRVRSRHGHLQDWFVRSLAISQLLPGAPGQYPARLQKSEHGVSTLHSHPGQCHHDGDLEPLWKHHQRLLREDTKHDGFLCGSAPAEPLLLLSCSEPVQGRLCDINKEPVDLFYEQIFSFVVFFYFTDSFHFIYLSIIL